MGSGGRVGVRAGGLGGLPREASKRQPTRAHTGMHAGRQGRGDGPGKLALVESRTKQQRCA